MTIAIIGASTDRRKYGNKAVRAWQKAGATVVPVNPKAGSVEGIPCVPSVLDYPDAIDIASLYVPPQVGLRAIEEIARKGIPEVYVNPGAESDELLAKAKELRINAMVACSIIGAGFRPDDFGDDQPKALGPGQSPAGSPGPTRTPPTRRPTSVRPAGRGRRA